jgi:hypothetical protein
MLSRDPGYADTPTGNVKARPKSKKGKATIILQARLAVPRPSSAASAKKRMAPRSQLRARADSSSAKRAIGCLQPSTRVRACGEHSSGDQATTTLPPDVVMPDSSAPPSAERAKVELQPDLGLRACSDLSSDDQATTYVTPSGVVPDSSDLSSAKRAGMTLSPCAPTRACPDLSSEANASVGLSHKTGMPSLSDLCQLIREAHRRRQDFHRPEKSMTLVIKSIERRYLGALKLKGAGDQAIVVTQGIPFAAPDLSSDEGQSPRDHHPLSADIAISQGARGHSQNAHRRCLAATPDLSSDEGQWPFDDQQIDADIALNAELGEDQSARDVPPTGVDPKLALYVQPLVEVRAALSAQRKEAERKCRKLAKQLPVWPWVGAVYGFGDLGLAQIVGECGDLGNYSNPAKLWKRMGLHVVDGKAARKSKAKGEIMGYSPARRAIMFCIGESLLKKQNAYRDLYLARKTVEAQKVPEGSKMLWHRRAQRYVEKRLLRDLWRAWRDAGAKS